MSKIDIGYYLPTRYGTRLLRPSKLARGMMDTIHRTELIQRQRNFNEIISKLSDDARELAVRGTTDKLAGGLWLRTVKVPCVCCGCKCRGQMVLNDKGRRRLRVLRLRR